jgi:hypothetical protein
MAFAGHPVGTIVDMQTIKYLNVNYVRLTKQQQYCYKTKKPAILPKHAEEYCRIHPWRLWRIFILPPCWLQFRRMRHYFQSNYEHLVGGSHGVPAGGHFQNQGENKGRGSR